MLHLCLVMLTWVMRRMNVNTALHGHLNYVLDTQSKSRQNLSDIISTIVGSHVRVRCCPLSSAEWIIWSVVRNFVFYFFFSPEIWTLVSNVLPPSWFFLISCYNIITSTVYFTTVLDITATINITATTNVCFTLSVHYDNNCVRCTLLFGHRYTWVHLVIH